MPALGRLALVGTLIKQSGVAQTIDKVDPKREAVDVYPSSDVVKSMLGLLCLAKTDFDDIVPFPKDGFFRKAMDLSRKKTPSSPTIRQRLAKQVVPGAKILCLDDSGNDSGDNIIACREEDADFIIKRNLRKESLEDWLALAKGHGRAIELRPGKMEYSGRLTVSVEKLDEPAGIAFRVIEGTMERKGQLLLTPEIEVETCWASPPRETNQIIDIYHIRGTFEQFHREFKNDMDLERLPSGYFTTNTRVMFLGMLAYNILRIIGQ